jgi:hypothetical protein
VRPVLSAILVFEAIVVLLAIPVAVSLGEVSGGLAGAVGGGVAAACLVATGVLRYPFGRWAGSALQVVAVALGFVVPLMFVLGVVFGALWFVCLAADRKIAAAQTHRGEGDG